MGVVPPFVGVAVNVTDIPAQIVVALAEIETLAGKFGLTVTAKVCAVLVPHELVAVTVTFPFCPDAPTVTVIEFVPVPAVIDQPVGTVQL